MAISEETETTTTDVDQPAARKAERSLVLVAGSGRSGTSLFSGILQRLGYHVPQPEVPADATNPRGFAESQWVVDFHTRLLAKAAVQVSDARPAAWSYTADAALDEGAHDELAELAREAVPGLRARARQGPAPLLVPAALEALRRGGRRLAALRHVASPPGGRRSTRSSARTGIGRATSAAQPAGSTRRSSRSARRGRARASSSATRTCSTTGRASSGASARRSISPSSATRLRPRSSPSTSSWTRA